ncbi:hypothetical protein HYY74_08350 [Candidatus Woesearchaeota archaeon]|nr:hypothetical protein [Candidatus Woesearchaeota archaeon]
MDEISITPFLNGAELRIRSGGVDELVGRFAGSPIDGDYFFTNHSQQLDCFVNRGSGYERFPHGESIRLGLVRDIGWGVGRPEYVLVQTPVE